MNAREARRLHAEGKPIPPRQKLTQAERRQLVSRIAFIIEVVTKGAKIFGGSHGSHLSFQNVGPGKFILRSSNPGHGFFVTFLHLGEPSIEEDLDPGHLQPEERLLEEIGGVFRAIRGGAEEVQRFFEAVARAPATVEQAFRELPEKALEGGGLGTPARGIGDFRDVQFLRDLFGL